MRSIKSKVLISGFLMASAVSLSACASSGVQIPDSLRTPCVSTVDVSTAETVGDLGRAIIQGDGDLRVCEARRSAVVAIAEGQRPWWARLRPHDPG